MPQVFHVLRCYQCAMFQVQQVKKTNKWSCKMCGEKQSVKKVYAQGSGLECRKHVQQLNMSQGTATSQPSYATHGNTSERYGGEDDRLAGSQSTTCSTDSSMGPLQGLIAACMPFYCNNATKFPEEPYTKTDENESPSSTKMNKWGKYDHDSDNVSEEEDNESLETSHPDLGSIVTTNRKEFMAAKRASNKRKNRSSSNQHINSPSFTHGQPLTHNTNSIEYSDVVPPPRGLNKENSTTQHENFRRNTFEPPKYPPVPMFRDEPAKDFRFTAISGGIFTPEDGKPNKLHVSKPKQSEVNTGNAVNSGSKWGNFMETAKNDSSSEDETEFDVDTLQNSARNNGGLNYSDTTYCDRVKSDEISKTQLNISDVKKGNVTDTAPLFHVDDDFDSMFNDDF